MQKRTFKIDNSIYPKDKILEVIPFFEGYTITYNDATGLEISSNSEDPQAVFDEFMNYLLAYLNE